MRENASSNVSPESSTLYVSASTDSQLSESALSHGASGAPARSCWEFEEGEVGEDNVCEDES